MTKVHTNAVPSEKEQQKCTSMKCKHAKNELAVHCIDAEDGSQFE